MYHNVLAQTSQSNFLQQQQQQQQSNNQQQPMQSQQYFCYPGALPPNQYVQSYQQEPYGVNQQQQQQTQRTGLPNLGQPLAPTSYNVPSIMQPQAVGYGSLPPHILDQIRSYIGSPGPIFILPNNCPNPPNQPAPVPTSPPTIQGCPGIGINCPSTGIHGCPAGSCYPYQVTMPMFNPYTKHHQQNTSRESQNCGCFPGRSTAQEIQPRSLNTGFHAWPTDTEEHRCVDGADDTICTRRNCPSAINLQALASQLLAIQGIISCAATRLVLRKVPGSNITTTMEETIERAKGSLKTLNKDQLLAETRGAQQVNALINLHMTANPPINVIPILTTLQLKVNLLKSQVEGLLNSRLSENQGIRSAEGSGGLDSVMLATKSDQELRDLLGTLRQKECDERVNLNFAPYQSQRVIAESRLSNIQNKIAQIEDEMDRRRASVLPRSAIRHQVYQQSSDPGFAAWYGYPGDINNKSWTTTSSSQSYESPDPFRGIQVRNPKRLNLKPHVGSPETTYDSPGSTATTKTLKSKKDSEDEDLDDNEKYTKCSPSAERRCCNCDKSSDDDSADEDKKKLGVKIHEAKEIASTRADREDERLQKGGISVVKLTPNVTIVIDDTDYRNRGNHRDDNERKGSTRDKIEYEAEKDAAVEPETKNLEQRNGTHGKVRTIGIKGSKKFKWSGKKVRAPDQPVKEAEVPAPAVEDSNAEGNVEKIEDNVEKLEEKDKKTVPVTEPIDQVPVSSRENSMPEALREETVRMINKIHYEPTVFRGFHDNDKSDKEKMIEERFKSSCTENSSLKSTSTESTVGSNSTNESVSLRVENYEEFCIDVPGQMDSKKNLKTVVEDKPQMGDFVEQGFTREIDKNIRFESKPDTSNKKEERLSRNDSQSGNGENGSGNDLISGALSTIGNHVASFGSIIGKIATLKLHRRDESSQDVLSESRSKSSRAIDPRNNDNAVATGSRGNSEKTEDTKKEIGRWKYIRFSDVPESRNASDVDVNSTGNNQTYTLPILKHSVIEDKFNGGKYVVVEKSSKHRNHELGEPYKTGRSLVIRSRLKNPESGEQSGPFTVVKGPRTRDKSCIPLSLVNVKSLGKNRFKNNRELRSSDKFWLRPETRDQRDDVEETSKVGKRLTKNRQAERSRIMNLDNSGINDPRCSIRSAVTFTDERVVQIHDYSRIDMNF